jgi:hypothetical protein
MQVAIAQGATNAPVNRLFIARRFSDPAQTPTRRE